MLPLEEKHHINKKAVKGEVGWEARERLGGRPGRSRGGEGGQGEVGRELRERAGLVQVEPLAPLWQSLCVAGHKGMWQSKECGHRFWPCPLQEEWAGLQDYVLPW